jgi:glutamine cyclotransferase
MMTLSAILIVINVLRWKGCSSLAAVGNNGVSGSSHHQRRILRKSRDYNLLEIAPHDTTAFTQGLSYHNGYIYESTGLEGQSRIMQLDPTNNMQPIHTAPLLPTHLFGEGIATYSTYITDLQTGKRKKEDRLIQLTWKTQIGYIYTIPNLQLIQSFNYTTTTNEGWGITYIPHTNEFAISDGSEYITYWDAETLLETRKIMVTTTLLSSSTPTTSTTASRDGTSSESSKEEGKTAIRIKYINELEFVNFHTNDDDDTQSSSMTTMTNNLENDNDNNNNNETGSKQQQQQQCTEEDGASCTDDNNNNNDDTSSSSSSSSLLTSTMYILANIWYEDIIVRIHPNTGNIDHIYNLSDLYPIEQRRVDGADCLNGIASITTTTPPSDGSSSGSSVEVWVTGKLWPYMYRIELIG